MMKFSAPILQKTILELYLPSRLKLLKQLAAAAKWQRLLDFNNGSSQVQKLENQQAQN